MAKEEKTENQSAKKSSSLKKIIVWIVVMIVAIGGGFATPLVIGQFTADPAHEAGHHGGEPAIPEPTDKVAYIDFDEIIVNLDESSFNRYLKMNFSLQVAETQKEQIEKLLQAKQAVLKNWLIGHVADKSMEDIRGKFGHNRLRREIHERFNAVLFVDGIERIQDILFREINIQ